MTITPDTLAMIRGDATAARANANEARSLLDDSGPVAMVCVGAEILAAHVERLAGEVERLSTLESLARKHHATCLGACGCSVCSWVAAARKASK